MSDKENKEGKEKKEGKEEKVEKKEIIGGVLGDEEDESDVTCPICLDNICSHFHSVCGALFCGSCIAEIVQREDDMRSCPTCRGKIIKASEILPIIREEKKSQTVERSLRTSQSPRSMSEEKKIQKEIDVWMDDGSSEKINVVIQTPEGKKLYVQVFESMPMKWIKAAISSILSKGKTKIDIFVEDVLVGNLNREAGDYMWENSIISYKMVTESEYSAAKGSSLQNHIEHWKKYEGKAYAEDKIDIWIRKLDGQKCRVNVYTEMKTHHLKQALAEMSEVCKDQIRFILRGYPLIDDYSLGMQNVKNGDTIHAIMQMRGS